jgi:glutathione S-transferase
VVRHTALHPWLREIGRSLDFLEEYIGEAGYAVGRGLTVAVGTLVPILLLVAEWLPIFRGPDLLAAHPKTAAYWHAIARAPICARLIDETRAALSAQLKR